MTGKLLVVLVTTPTEELAKSIATTLVEERIAACVNILPSVRSIYRWQGRICDEAEVLLLIKTHSAQWDQLKTRISDLHSYETPEVVALSATDVSEGYLSWALNETNS